uniref:Uncharacterized protein n=1 Tax=Cyprinus carpio TaxID=7962 RepID=A0A8C1TAA7_CYPCA
ITVNVSGLIFPMLCLAYIYGDIMKIDTTGASEATAKQYKLTIKAENHDLARVEKYKNMITKVGKAKKMDLAVIAAMISRESRAGAVLKNGWEPRIRLNFELKTWTLTTSLLAPPMPCYPLRTPVSCS